MDNEDYAKMAVSKLKTAWLWCLEIQIQLKENMISLVPMSTDTQVGWLVQAFITSLNYNKSWSNEEIKK